MLRLTAAIGDKYERKYRKYQRQGIIQEGDAYLVAINASTIPYACVDAQPLPRIVRTLLPIGGFQVVLDGAFRVVKQRLTRKSSIQKQSGTAIPKDIFLRSEYEDLSAVLYSLAHPVNGPREFGKDFIMVHNPSARNPLDPRVISLGREYSVEKVGTNYKIACTDHRHGSNV